MPTRGDRSGFTLIEAIVTVLVLVVLLVILLPAIQRARESARRTHATNNLKIIGLALHNYHDVHVVFPPGGVFDAEGKAFHCWTTFIRPFLDASPWYNGVNFNVPWDDPRQTGDFRSPIPIFLTPGANPHVSSDGLPLVHYAANQKIFYRNSSTSIGDIATGTSNTLAISNAFGNFEPLGYPYNWRDASLGLNVSQDGFGDSTSRIHLLLMCDGHVRKFGQHTDSGLFSALGGINSGWSGNREDVAKPSGPYRIPQGP